MIEVIGDLLGPAAGGEVLGAMQRRAALSRRELQQVGGDDRDRAAGAALPGCVGGGVDDDLAHDAPSRVMGLAAGDEEAGEGFGEHRSVGLGTEIIEVAKGFANALAAFYGTRKFARAASGAALEAE